MKKTEGKKMKAIIKYEKINLQIIEMNNRC